MSPKPDMPDNAQKLPKEESENSEKFFTARSKDREDALDSEVL